MPPSTEQKSKATTLQLAEDPYQSAKHRLVDLWPRKSANARRWLDWQCRMISNVHSGAVFIVREEKTSCLETLAVWPDADVNNEVLSQVSDKAVAELRVVTQSNIRLDGNSDEVCDCIAYPLICNDQFLGTVVLALATGSDTQREAVERLLQWGVIWLQDQLQHSSDKPIATLSLELDSMKLAAQDLPLGVSANELCSFLADKLGCARVALGIHGGLKIHTLALSHQLNFDRRLATVGRIELAMKECANQGRIVCLPGSQHQTRDIVAAHESLLNESGNHAVCSIPMLAGTEVFGVFSFIRARGPAFDDRALQTLKNVVATIAPILAIKLNESRSLSQKTGQGLRALAGYRYWRKKMAAIAMLAFIAVAAIVEIDYRVSASASIDGTLRRVLVAPYGGYLESASARAGDQVKKNQVLAVLDSSDLQLEQERLSSEREKYSKEYLQALSESDRAKVSIARARVAQTEAELQRTQTQLERAQVIAPFDGVLVDGDLSQLLGVPVERGQLLFELVPLNGVSAVLMVDEHDVGDLRLGQRGEMRLTSLPGKPLDFEVMRILPLANTFNQSNAFRVEVRLDSKPGGLRLGMRGVAKVVIGKESALWVWCRPLVNRVRLWLWSWGL